MLGKTEKRIHSKAWLDMLTGESVEKANTRVDEKSQIDYSFYERQINEQTGEEKMVKVKHLKGVK